MRKIVIAPDSFKGSLSAKEVAATIAEGIHEVLPDVETVCMGVADGGEGTVEVLVEELHGNRISVPVTGPLGTSVEAEYGYLPKEETAVIEIAKAVGLPLVPQEKRNPLNTTSYGVGELILHALDQGCRKFLIGLGGSATNDCGIGLLSALGCRFLDEEGKILFGYGRDVERIRTLDLSEMDPRLKESVILVASDVKNPLTGENGASYVFAPQKGADPETVKRMDAAHRSFAELMRRQNDFSDQTDTERQEGAGAAGGIGYALLTFLHARISSGIQLVLELLQFDGKLNEADLVITGEGRFDAQSRMGKVVGEIAKRSAKRGIPLLVIPGCMDENMPEEVGFQVFPVNREPFDLKSAMEPECAKKRLKVCAAEAIKSYVN